MSAAKDTLPPATNQASSGRQSYQGSRLATIRTRSELANFDLHERSGSPADYDIGGETLEGRSHLTGTFPVGSEESESADDPPAYAESSQGLEIDQYGLHANVRPVCKSFVSAKAGATS